MGLKAFYTPSSKPQETAAQRRDPPHLLSLDLYVGSEFMAEFERACRDLDIFLFVLPPRRPQLNEIGRALQGHHPRRVLGRV